VSKGVEATLVQLLETGLLHADPRPGKIHCSIMYHALTAYLVRLAEDDQPDSLLLGPSANITLGY
ncbi:hypothetical protein L195_g034809, partial [Trifolium pratense]